MTTEQPIVFQPPLAHVLVEIDAGIAWVTLNRPDKRNAMSPALNDEMVRVLDALEIDERVAIVVLTGAGDSFAAVHGSQRSSSAISITVAVTIRNPCAKRSAWQWQWKMLLYYPKPTIAMVNGWCFGGAFTPLVACDLAIAAEEAQFGLSEINWGISPRSGQVDQGGDRRHTASGCHVLRHDGRDLQPAAKAAGDAPRKRGRAAQSAASSGPASWRLLLRGKNPVPYCARQRWQCAWCKR